MKNRNLNLILMLVGWCYFAGVAQADNLSNIVDQNKLTSVTLVMTKTKLARPGSEYKPDPQVILQGGDTFEDAFVITSLPYSDAGTTIGYTDNYNATCPYPDGSGPDVVYKFTPTTNMLVDISLCANSAYDTKLYVHANSYVPGGHIACNDDACRTPSYPESYVSRVTGVALIVGNTYYITVDGYSQSSAGTYTIDIVSYDPCPIICPPDAIPEGEPVCGPGYIDAFNVGCGMRPPVFSPISNGDTICGTTGSWMEGEQIMWDTDWYKVIDVGEGELHWSAVCDFWSTMVIMDAGSGDCSDFSTIAWGSADACDTARMVEYVSGGTYWLWIAPVTQTTPCPSDYVTWVECVPANNCCDVDMVPDNYPISVPPGGSFGLTGFVSNPTPNPIITDVWVGVIYQYLFYQIWDFPNIALNPGQGVNAHLNQYVPGYAPAGSYEYIAYCGDYPDNICDSVRFDFTVTGGRIDGGADEWTLKGRFEAVDTPSEFALKNSHPNPFNATTTITYDVPLAGIVTLDVFNLMGQKVAILVDGKVEAGQHSVTWDAENYSSGIYFYKLTAGGKTFNKRMTLLK